MKLRWIVLFILAAAISAWLAYSPKPVKASNDCPVTDSTPDGKGGATVVFNCQAYIITIHEPVWP